MYGMELFGLRSADHESSGGDPLGSDVDECGVESAVTLGRSAASRDGLFGATFSRPPAARFAGRTRAPARRAKLASWGDAATRFVSSVRGRMAPFSGAAMSAIAQATSQTVEAIRMSSCGTTAVARSALRWLRHALFSFVIFELAICSAVWYYFKFIEQPRVGNPTFWELNIRVFYGQVFNGVVPVFLDNRRVHKMAVADRNLRELINCHDSFACLSDGQPKPSNHYYARKPLDGGSWVSDLEAISMFVNLRRHDIIVLGRDRLDAFVNVLAQEGFGGAPDAPTSMLDAWVGRGLGAQWCDKNPDFFTLVVAGNCLPDKPVYAWLAHHVASLNCVRQLYAVNLRAQPAALAVLTSNVSTSEYAHAMTMGTNRKIFPLPLGLHVHSGLTPEAELAPLLHLRRELLAGRLTKRDAVLVTPMGDDNRYRLIYRKHLINVRATVLELDRRAGAHWAGNRTRGAERSHATQNNSADVTFQHPSGFIPPTIITERLPRHEFQKLIAQYKFVLSPPGVGYDCYRTWEIVLLGSVPIVHLQGVDNEEFQETHLVSDHRYSSGSFDERLFDDIDAWRVRGTQDLPLASFREQSLRERGNANSKESLPPALLLSHWRERMLRAMRDGGS